MIKAIIYDMDGILIDSEPFWRKAEIQSFAAAGIQLTEEMSKQTTGLKVNEVVEYWLHRFPTRDASPEQIEESIMENIILLVKESGELKEGVKQSLDFFKKHGYRLALASSSSMTLINTALEKLKIKQYFEVIHSAEFEEHGKPNPGVYITTARKLELKTRQCTAIEDSINGVIAAKAAKMKCIAIPEKDLHDDKRLGIADVILNSLLQINGQTLDQINN